MRSFLDPFPLLSTLRGYRREDFRADLLAGLTVALVEIPQSMAYAMIAGLPPVYGLYCSMVAAVFAAPFGSSRHITIGPTNGIALLVASRLSHLPEGMHPEEVLFSLTLLVGCIQIGFALLRVGSLVNYISHAVILGYTSGAGILIAINQVPNLLGIHSPRHPGFVSTLGNLAGGIRGTHVLSLSIGLATLILAVTLRRLSRRIPAMLVAIVAATLLTELLGGRGPGNDASPAVRTIRDIGAIPRRIPPPAFPPLRGPLFEDLFGSALAIAVLGVTEALSIARSIASKSGQALDPNQEFLGLGFGNVGAALFHGMPGGGSLTRSTVNYESGGQTRVSGVFCGVATAVLVLALAPLANRIPIPALAGILLFVAWKMVDFGGIRSALHSTRTDTAAFLVTFGATLSFPSRLDLAILAGVAFSILSFVRKASVLHVSEMGSTKTGQFREIDGSPEKTCPQISLLHLEGDLFFGAAYDLGDRLREIAGRKRPKVIILRTKRAQNIDLTTLGVLRQFSRAFRAQGGILMLCGVRPELKAMIDRMGLRDEIGEENVFVSREDIFASTQEAVQKAYRSLDYDVCRPCKARVFRECATFPGGDAC